MAAVILCVDTPGGAAGARERTHYPTAQRLGAAPPQMIHAPTHFGKLPDPVGAGHRLDRRVDSLDTFLSIIERYGVSIAFAIYCAAEVRVMRQQMLKTEREYSMALTVLNQQLIDLMKEYTIVVRDYTDAARGLKDQIHELKNVIQRGVFDSVRPSGRRGDDD